MKQNLRKVELLEEVGNKAKGVQVVLSAPTAAKLIKDGKAKLISSEAKAPEKKQEVKQAKKKKK